MVARKWTDALSLGDFGHVMAEWYESNQPHMPTNTYHSHVPVELQALAPSLAAVCRGGLFIVREAQPGCSPEHQDYGGAMATQRAAVMGYVPESALERVGQTVAGAGLSSVFSPSGSPSRKSYLAVGRTADGVNVTWYGYVSGPGELSYDYEGLLPELIGEIKKAYQVFVYDPQWGRNDRLWPALNRLAG